MNTNDFFYPELKVEIGSYSFSQGVEVEVHSAASSYFDWAKIIFTEQLGEEVIINKLDEAIVKLGYNGAFEDVFKGYAKESINTLGGSQQNEIILKDDMLKLEKTIITNTFIDVAPREMIEHVLREADIQSFKLTNKTHQIKKVVPVFRMSAIDVIEEIHNLWGIQEAFFFADKTFYWGDKPNQSTNYEFEYAVNIIDLNFENGLWELQTVAAPLVRHSQEIRVVHPKTTGEFEVTKVIFSTTGNGFARSKIYFKGDV
ncbi:MAG: serine/arginine repetitive matrix protein 2 [Alkaliphilus sp.]|nr:MAG: serine/arginine repetitive matrix protein 2 [Alkaliphilus sp.]